MSSARCLHANTVNIVCSSPLYTNCTQTLQISSAPRSYTQTAHKLSQCRLLLALIHKLHTNAPNNICSSPLYTNCTQTLPISSAPRSYTQTVHKRSQYRLLLAPIHKLHTNTPNNVCSSLLYTNCTQTLPISSDPRPCAHRQTSPQTIQHTACIIRVDCRLLPTTTGPLCTH